jgi:hypothetical protein
MRVRTRLALARGIVITFRTIDGVIGFVSLHDTVRK